MSRQQYSKIIPSQKGVEPVFLPYVTAQMPMLKPWTIFLISCSIVFISSIGNTGIPLKEGMTPQEVQAQFEEMKHQREEIIRELQKEQQKKEEELAKREQLIKASQPPTPATAEEKPSAQEKEVRKGGEEEKAISTPAPTGEIGKGLVPGVITPEQESEKVKKTEKQEKAEKEYKTQRNFSFILMIIVMVATIGLLIKSMSKGKTKNEEEKK
ncbi:MAG: hypothetical protein QME42_03570 [bacterium]|nr:hypothetical protein [bacterium]